MIVEDHLYWGQVTLMGQVFYFKGIDCKGKPQISLMGVNKPQTYMRCILFLLKPLP